MKKEKIKEEFWRFLLVAFGTILFSLAINLFITPMNLFNGGAIGIAQMARVLLTDILNLKFPESIDVAGIIYLAINIPLFLLAYKGVSLLFCCKTALSVALTTFIITIIPIPKELIVEDTLTSCIIGGLMYGAGVGLCLYAGGSGGGIDILGIFFSKNYKNISVGKVSVAINSVIYLICALLFDWEIAIYSIIYAAITSLTIDRVHAQNIMTQVMIFTKKENIAAPIMHVLGRGVTEWEGEGAYTHEGTHILVTAISKYEINLLRRIVTTLDPQAFIIYNKVMDIDGNYVKKL